MFNPLSCVRAVYRDANKYEFYKYAMVGAVISLVCFTAVINL